MTDRDWGKALITESKRRLFEESVPRLKKCLDNLTDDEIWCRPNAETVSVGNLVLHLCGNARQWICSGLGGQADHRQRSKEFAETGPIPRGALLATLDHTMADVERTLDSVDPASLLDKRPVQTYEESGLSILVHVVEHFSYHTGQVTYAVKSRKGVDVGYYAGQKLERS